MPVTVRPNAWVAVEDDQPTQLTYAPQVDPAPLTVSVTGRPPTLGSLTVVITNGTPDVVNVTSVTLTIVVGTPGVEGPPLMPTTEGAKTIVSDTTTWTFTGPPSPVTSGTADFVLAPATGSTAALAAGASVVVQLYDFETVVAPTTSAITVKEIISGGDPVFTTISISTFPDGFYFDSLLANVQNGSALVPVAQVGNGSTVTLTWNSSVVDSARQTVYYSNATQGQQSATPAAVGAWASPPLTSDTTFVLEVTAESVGDEPLTAALAVTVSVQNPALVASSLSTGSAIVTGNASVGGSLTANGITATGLAVDGALSASSAALSGSLNAGSATVGGNVAAASATVSGALQATTATITSALKATSSTVSMLTGVQGIPAGAYGASTDCLIIGTVGSPSSSVEVCVAWLWGSCNGVSVSATGGNLGGFADNWKTYWSASNTSSFVLPVPTGQTVQLSVQYGSKNQVNPPVWFWVVPLGTARTGDKLLTRHGDADPGLFPTPQMVVQDA